MDASCFVLFFWRLLFHFDLGWQLLLAASLCLNAAPRPSPRPATTYLAYLRNPYENSQRAGPFALLCFALRLLFFSLPIASDRQEAFFLCCLVYFCSILFLFSLCLHEPPAIRKSHTLLVLTPIGETPDAKSR